MNIKLFILLPLTAIATSCAATGGGAMDPVHNAALASNAQFARSEFIKKGLQPIEEAARHGREVRRVLVRSFVPGDLPALELEKAQNGTVTLALVRGGALMQRVPVPAETWKRLVALDGDVYAPSRRPAPVTGSTSSVSCHGTGAFFEAASRGKVLSASARQCAGAASPFTAGRREAMMMLVDLALAVTPRCGRKAGEDVDWALSRCFS